MAQMTAEEREDFDKLCTEVIGVEVGSPYYDVLLRHRERDDDNQEIDPVEGLVAMLETVVGRDKLIELLNALLVKYNRPFGSA